MFERKQARLLVSVIECSCFERQRERVSRWAYLVRFDSPGQLWCEVKVFLLCRVIDINQHLTLGVRQV